MGLLERVKEIEAEMARTQKNKATEYHLGKLKAQMAKFKSQLLEGGKSGGGKGEGFEVARQGDGRVALIGFPSVGKSTLLNALTTAQSEAAAYEFTTLTCVPGVIEYNDAKIQLLDLPGIIEGAAEGRGRGRQVIAVAKSCDLVLMILDATKDDSQKVKLERELHSVGIRLNRGPPQIKIVKKKTGGISFNSTVPLTRVDQKGVQIVLNEYKIFNADVLVKEDIEIDDVIDVIEGNRQYISCLYAYNKVDLLSMPEIKELASRPMTVVISSTSGWGLEYLLPVLWNHLGLRRVYTKKKGEGPDFGDPVILTPQRGDGSVKSAVRLIHKDLANNMKCAFVWGRSVKHSPQQVGGTHQVADEDVIQVILK